MYFYIRGIYILYIFLLYIKIHPFPEISKLENFFLILLPVKRILCSRAIYKEFNMSYNTTGPENS